MCIRDRLTRCTKLIQTHGWEVRITHCYQEANHVADKLVNIGVELSSGCNVYHNPPSEVRDVMYADNIRAALAQTDSKLIKFPLGRDPSFTPKNKKQ